MSSKKISIWLVMVTVLSAIACKPAESPAITPGPVAGTPASVKQSWQDDWEKTLSAARREGKIVMYLAVSPELRYVYSKAMAEKYGLEMEFVQGAGPELVRKVLNERQMGLYYGDLYFAGAATAIASLIPEGALDPVKPLLSLPEVLDTRYWYASRLPYLDSGERLIGLRGDPRRPFAINTSLVKREEIVSYKDILAPKFKGRIIMGDPTVPGGAQSTATGVAEYILGWDYIRELAKQEPVIIGDNRQVAEWVARGKYPVAFGAWSSLLAPFQKAGAPLVEIIPKEGSFLEAGSAVASVVNKRPHPNAAKVFVNWLLTKEAQTAFAETVGYQSLREDVSIAHLDPGLAREPGKKYFIAGEDFEIMRQKVVPTIKEIFAPLMK